MCRWTTENEVSIPLPQQKVEFLPVLPQFVEDLPAAGSIGFWSEQNTLFAACGCCEHSLVMHIVRIT